MSPEETEATCPVAGCFYTGPPASVAGHVSGKKDTAHDWDRLGYDGANQYKREQRSSPQNDTSPAFIGWLTDSHIGKKRGDMEAVAGNFPQLEIYPVWLKNSVRSI